MDIAFRTRKLKKTFDSGKELKKEATWHLLPSCPLRF